MTNEQLLRAYTEGRSEAAFAELVQRHVDLVYSTALRTVGQPQLAQDVAQAVFVHLARKAGSIRKASALPGWLYRVACDQAANAVRGERRRRQREQEALKRNSTTGEESAAWGEIAPLLEEAMRTLPRRDQDAVVLRFFHGQSLRQVGEALELSEDAAQKRLSRALERLRGYFARRGVRVSAAVLAGGLAAHAVHAAPAGVGAAISTAVITSGAALHGAGILGLAKLGFAKGIIMTTTQKIAVAAMVTLAVGTGLFEAHRAGQMRAKLQGVERQIQPLTEAASQLRRERDQTAATLKDAQDQIELLQGSTAELLRLRGEVARLRQEAQEFASLKPQNPANPPVPAAATSAPSSEPVPAELAARIALLQQNLQQRPERQIPELRYADEKDWLEAARLATTESDIDVRKALSLLRTSAKLKFSRVFRPALRQYTEANNGDLPTDLSQLKPFFKEPLDDAILQRYAMIATGNTGEPGFDPYKPVVHEKAEALPDRLYDAMLSVSLNGSGAGGGRNVILPDQGPMQTLTTDVMQMRTRDGRVFTTSDGKALAKP